MVPVKLEAADRAEELLFFDHFPFVAQKETSEFMERYGLSSSVLFLEEYTLKFTSTVVVLLYKPTYKVRVHVQINSRQLYQNICHPDIGAGLHSVNKAFRHKKWHLNIINHKLLKLRSAIMGLITLTG